MRMKHFIFAIAAFFVSMNAFAAFDINVWWRPVDETKLEVTAGNEIDANVGQYSFYVTELNDDGTPKKHWSFNDNTSSITIEPGDGQLVFTARTDAFSADVDMNYMSTTLNKVYRDRGWYSVWIENKNYGSNPREGSGKISVSGRSGQPLPTPVATLLIALGLGAALVMYRSRKQAKA